MKFKQGFITNGETGVTKNITVTAAAPNNLKETLIGGCLVLVGVIYLTSSAFRRGAKAFEAAEVQAMVDCGVMEFSEAKN